MNSNRHPYQTKYVAIGRLLALVALAILAMTAASPAQAQMGPSGSLTVQMRVGDALVEEVLDGGIDGSGQQGLAAGGCNVPTGMGLSFGTVAVQAGNKLPPLVAGTAFSFSCSTAIVGEQPFPELIVSVGASSQNGNLMTLGGFPGPSGIAYELCGDEFCARSLAESGGFVIANTSDPGGNFIQFYTVPLTARVTTPVPSNLRLTPGTYRDTLSVTISF